jgi:hypothetical protein
MFSENVATGDADSSTPGEGPAIGLLANPAPSAVWLQGCTFEENEGTVEGDVFIETKSCSVYSDDEDVPWVWSSEEGRLVTPQWLQTHLERGVDGQVTWGPTDGRPFLNEDTQEFAALRQVR